MTVITTRPKRAGIRQAEVSALIRPRPCRRWRILLAALVSAMAAACASLPPDTTREHLAATMQQALGQPVHWQDRDQAELENRLAALLGEPLTPDAAVQVALLHSRSLRRLFAELGLAQADYLAAASLPNPVVDIETRRAGGGHSTSLDVAIVQHFLAVLRLKGNREIANARLRAAALRITSEVLALRGQVLTAYYGHIANQQLLEMRRRIAQAAGGSLEFAQRLYQAGNIRALDLANEQAQHEAARVGVAEAEFQVMASREQLGRALELWRPDVAWTTPARLPKIPRSPVSLDDLEAKAVGQNLRLRADRLLLESQYRQLGMARSTRWVDEFEVGLVGEREDGDWERGLGLGLSLPVFEQGQAKVLQAESRVALMESELYLDAMNLRSMAREAAVGLGQARRMVEHDLDVRLPLATRILGQTQLEVNAMQGGLFELMMAKRGQIEAGSAFVKHLRDYWMARVVVDQLKAGGTPELVAMTLAVERSAGLPVGESGGH